MRRKALNIAATSGLRQARENQNWSQQELADLLGTSAKNISRWESNTAVPTPYYRRKLCELFNASGEALGLTLNERPSFNDQIIVVPSSRSTRPSFSSFSQQNFLMAPDETSTTPYRVRLREDMLRQYAEAIQWGFLEKDWDLWAVIFQETEEIAVELRIMPQTVRRLLSHRVYAFFSLLTGRVVHGRATACRLALQYGIFQVEEEAEGKH